MSISITADHTFDRATVLTANSPGVYDGQTSPAYGNMVGPFGGITAATILQAVLQHPDLLGEPVALTVNFAGAVANGPYVVTARAARTNRSTQHWSIELTQGEQVAVTATAVTATRRDTWSSSELPCPVVPSANEVARTPPIDWAAWTKNYDMRFVRGNPESVSEDSPGLPESLAEVWLRDDPPRALDFLSLTAICDAFYPRLYLRRYQRVPVGTVSITIYFHADGAALAGQGDAAVLGVARGQHFGKGFFDQAAQVWGSSGVMLASTHQVVYFKE